MTIKDAAIKVLRNSGPLMPSEIMEQITKEGLFEFKAQIPLTVLTRVLRKHSEGITNNFSSAEKHFRIVGQKFTLLL